MREQAATNIKCSNEDLLVVYNQLDLQWSLHYITQKDTASSANRKSTQKQLTNHVYSNAETVA